MKIEQTPDHIKEYILPKPSGKLIYNCLDCGMKHSTDKLHYTCPSCGGLLLIENQDDSFLLNKSGQFWRDLFDYRKIINHQGLRGIFTFHEFLAPLIPLEDVIYLGEGHTPLIKSPIDLANEIGADFYIKHDGQNPSASFKDRGMAAAFSYLKYLVRTQNIQELLAVCASTGDTSAAASLYAASLGGKIKSAVLLPKGKVTMAQLSQPLGSGAKVFELPGVFDDCMNVVAYLSDHYDVALLNSKNPWRILGQESYAYELAQQLDYDLSNTAVFVPIGNAGNITAIMSGFIKLFRYKVIDSLPTIVGVQSVHADPVFLYFKQSKAQRQYHPVTVRPSVAQAAMIGDPVSFPRVLKMVSEYEKLAGKECFYVVEVSEQEIIENMLKANRHGFTICTQGGESLAGFRKALSEGVIDSSYRGIIDSTAHALKFTEFQNAYFEDKLKEGYEINSDPNLINTPQDILPANVKLPQAGTTLSNNELKSYVEAASKEIAAKLGLKPLNK